MEGLYRKQILANGITAITEEIPHLRSVSLGFWVKTGARYESLVQNGISHFIEHLLFKGTKRYTAAEIAQTIDSVGGALDASTSHEFTCYYASVLDEQLKLALDLLAELVFHPEFDPQELELERQVIFEEIKTTEDTPDDHIHTLLANTLWPDHPLGRSIIGSAKSISDITRTQIIDYFRQCYQPNNIVITAAGNVKHERLINMLDEWQTPIPEKSHSVSHQKPPRFNRQVRSFKKDLEQVHLCIGTKGLPQNHPNRYAAELLNIILGSGNSSRLFQQIREQRGLAYSIYSYFTPYSDTGMGTIYAATNRKSYMEVIELVLKELKILKNEGITQDELERSKNHVKGHLTLSLESSFNRMSTLAKYELYLGCQFCLGEILDCINQVSVCDVNQLANELFDDRYLALVALGSVNDDIFSPAILSR
jgi:predicted Zn-dependent peptidase